MNPPIVIIIVDDTSGPPPGTISNDNGWSGGWVGLPA